MNLRRQFIAAIAASAVFPFAASAAKVSSVSIKTVDGIAGDVSDILSQCTVKAGSQFDADACRRDVRALVDSQRYERVSVETADTADGVEVVYVVQRKFRFKGPIVVRGAKAFSESKIASLAKFKDGALIGPADIEAVRGFIEREYRKKFYPDVKVGVAIVPAEGGAGAATVEIDVSEGARIDFGEFVFMGNESIPADELRASTILWDGSTTRPPTTPNSTPPPNPSPRYTGRKASSMSSFRVPRGKTVETGKRISCFRWLKARSTKWAQSRSRA